MISRLVLVGWLAFGSFGVAAAATTSPQAAAGTVTGTIRSVDFRQSNALVTVTSGNTTTDVLVTPGTLIQAGATAPRASFVGGRSHEPMNGYRTMTDLRPGAQVQIYTTQSAGKLTASIVILQK